MTEKIESQGITKVMRICSPDVVKIPSQYVVVEMFRSGLKYWSNWNQPGGDIAASGESAY